MRSLVLVLALLAAPGCVSMKKYNALEQKVTRLQKEVALKDAIIQKRMAQFRELMADFKPLIDKGLLEVEVVDGRVVIGMSSDVLFASGSATLSDKGKDALREVGAVLKRKPEYEFQVEGHTDDDAINTPQFPSNWYLGAARAITVVEYLVDSGMSPTNLSAASFAQYSPVFGNDTPAHKARNRRIELVLLPDLSDLPGYEQLMDQKERPARQRKPGGKPPQGR